MKKSLEKEISKSLDRPEIIGIVGARQCGKTTLSQQFYNRLNNANYIDFEDGILEYSGKDIHYSHE